MEGMDFVYAAIFFFIVLFVIVGKLSVFLMASWFIVMFIGAYNGRKNRYPSAYRGGRPFDERKEWKEMDPDKVIEWPLRRER